uniref:nucleotidyltransferase domain-containing protein n=1 Tax=Rheinheimera sp. TaxID=1869214 RepID=UPI0040484D96
MSQAVSFSKALPDSYSLDSYKKHFAEFYDWLGRSFSQHPVNSLVKARAHFIDDVLVQLWHKFDLHKSKDLSLIAVGGYGRGELHPCSDIDLLLLAEGRLSATQQEAIGQVITVLWDLRLEVGHSVRTLKESLTLGKDDITIATNLLEMRLLTGNKTLFEQLQ